MRYLVRLSYDGLNYVGFQSQINGLAIQDEIERVLKIITKEDIRIIMASRTDSGVHALDQVIHFDSDKKLDLRKLKVSMNALLNDDIHINHIEIVDEDFHARFNVKHKTYLYLMNINEYNVFYKNRAFYTHIDLDLALIKEAMELFIGEHDFTSFNTSPLDLYPNQVREIYHFNLIQKDDLLIFEIDGSGFLRHMVRMIIGTLYDVGRGKKNLEDVRKMLEKPSKDYKVYNISPNGLYLKKIYY